MESVLYIFNSADADPVPTIRERLDKANNKAGPIWNDYNKKISARYAECDPILSPVISRNLRGDSGEFNPIPDRLTGTLDKIFRKHYPPSRFLLMGQAHEEAYHVQDAYACDVAEVVGTLRSSYQSRALTVLGKAYGRASIPLLTLGSTSALWQICQHSFYKKQLSLVSSACTYADKLTDS